MTEVILAIHLMIAAALVAVVLLQRSEGGGLGIGKATGSEKKRAFPFKRKKYNFN